MNRLQIVLEEINRLSSVGDMPRRIALCQEALKMFSREENPRLWGAIHNDLGMSLMQTINGVRADNIEKAILHFEEAVKVRPRKGLPKEWALTKNNLANALRDRIRGDRARNIERAIICYRQALKIRTRDEYPEEWANTQNNLGAAYYKRIRGNRAENLEQAIRHSFQALRVYTRRKFPHYWARANSTLGEIYRLRVCGSRAKNIERAIYHFDNALEVHTIQKFPQDWAAEQNSLGNAYLVRIRDERGGNFERAIFHYEESLKVRTRESDPVHWALVQHNLGNVHRNRSRGGQMDNIQKAIHYFQQALEVRTRDALPEDWAQTQNALGNAFLSRSDGEREENIERAIACFQQALEVYAEQAHPIEWAEAKNDLGNAYLGRILGERMENIEKAIQCYNDALKVRTRETFPEEWAQTLNNLAGAERTRANESIEQSITLLQQVLEVRTREAYPHDWAETQNNLAIAYTDRIHGDRAENIQQAIKHYEQALDVYTQAMPWHCLRTARALGNLAFEQQYYELARKNYQKAFDARDVLLHDSLSRASKQTELGEAQNLPPRAAYAHVKCNDIAGAIQVLETGRAQLMRESLERRWLEELPGLGFTDLYKNYKQATALYDVVERMRDSENARPDGPSLQLDQVSGEVQVALKAIREKAGEKHPQYRYFMEALPLDEILTLTREKNIVYLCSTSAGGLALIVGENGERAIELPNLDQISLQKQIWSPTDKEVERINDHINKQKELTREDIQAVRGGYFSSYSLWSLSSFVPNTPIELLDGLTSAWFNALDNMTYWLWDAGIGELVETLKTQHKPIIFIPVGQLAMLPLHAAWKKDLSRPTGRLYALDELNISYVPSMHALWQASLSAGRPFESLLAVDNPDGTLSFAEQEVGAILSLFTNCTHLRGGQATVKSVNDALHDANVLHFATHGNAGWQEEEQARLKLADNKYLTLPDIFNIKLERTRLAVLSACETGAPSLKLIDEMFSLPAGMMQAGVPGVVGSLWSVNDMSTALLMQQFYKGWKRQGLAPQDALKQAQIWVRDQLIKYKSPFFWAAFAYTGI
jgi:tetratricopeptide (TPR) repeat protein